MNPLAEELNATLRSASPALYGVLSELGRELFFPEGILTQTAEARERAHLFDATIGIAREGGRAMSLPAVMGLVNRLSPDQSLDYAPSTGNPVLRRRWLADMRVKNPSLEGREVSLPVVTCGITHGLAIAGELFVDPGDAVVLPDKFWGNYRMVYATRRKAEIRTFPLFDGSGGFDTGALAGTLSRTLDEKGKAILILNFPNNPTGYSIRRAEAGDLVETLLAVSGEGRDLVVVLDDAYFGLFYEEDVLTESLFALLAGAGEHLFCVKLDGATKEEYAWGLRLGFITFGVAAGGREVEVYTALEKKVGGAIRGNVSNCPQLSQSVLLAAMDDPGFAAQKEEKYRLMKARALEVGEVLADPRFEEAWEPYPFNSGYFMCVRLKGLDAEEFRVSLLEKYGIGVIAESGTDIRIAFSCMEVEDIPVLFEKMYDCAKGLR